MIVPDQMLPGTLHSIGIGAINWECPCGLVHTKASPVIAGPAGYRGHISYVTTGGLYQQVTTEGTAIQMEYPYYMVRVVRTVGTIHDNGRPGG